MTMRVIRRPLAALRHAAKSRRLRTAVVVAAAGAFALRARSVISAAPRRSQAIAKDLSSDLRVMFGKDEPGSREESSPAGTPAAQATAKMPASGRHDADNTGNTPGDRPAGSGAVSETTVEAGEDETGTFRPTRAETDEYGVVVTDEEPAGLTSGDWVKGDGSPNCPDDHPIKGNTNSRIYHLPGEPNYERTIPGFCFATEEDAVAAGYRPRAK
jgi:hypothetical protein